MQPIIVLRIVLFIFAFLMLVQCNVGKYELVYPAHVGLLIDMQSNQIISKSPIVPSKVFVPKQQKLVTFNLLPDTILIKGNAITKDSLQIIYHCELVYQLQEGNIIPMYQRHGGGYEPSFVEPESKFIVRKILSKLDTVNLNSHIKRKINTDLNTFLNDHYSNVVSINSFEWHMR